MKVLERTELSSEHVQLDLKDKKILKILSVNARFPLTKIAKQLKLSRDAVKYRIEKLEKNDIITGYLTLINPKKFGFTSYHLFLELHADAEKESRLIKNFKENESINCVLKYSGKLDYELAIVSRNFEEFDRILSDLINKDPVKSYEILIILNTIKSVSFPEKLLEEKITIDSGKNDGSFFKDFSKSSNKNLNMDKHDIKILGLLAENSRIPIIELSSQVKLSQDAISYRIKKMIDSKIILEFRPVINFSKLKFYVYTVLLSLKNLNEKREKEFRSYLKNNPNILWAVKTVGKWNVLLYAITRNEEEFHDTMHEIKRDFSDIINSYEALLADREYKYTYFPEVMKKIDK